MRVQLEGIPPSALADRTLELTVLFQAAPEQADWGPLQRRSVNAQTDEAGIAEFIGLPPGPVQLALREAERVYDLVEVLDARGSWDVERTPVIRVRPVEALVAIVPADATDLEPFDAPYAIVPATSEPSPPQARPDGGVLVPRAWLDAPHGMEFLSFEHARRPFGSADLREALADAYVLALDEREPPCAVRVLVDGAVPETLRIEVQRVVDGTHLELMPFQRGMLHEAFSPGEPTDVRAGRIVQRIDEGFLVRGLWPGRYRLSWTWHFEAARPFAEVELHGGQTVAVRTAAVEVRTVRGRVVPWEDTPEALRPRTVALDGLQSDLDAGRFESQVLFPPAPRVQLLGPGMLLWEPTQPPTWDEQAGELIVHARSDELVVHRLHVPALLGGRVVAEVHRDPASGAAESRRPYFVQPDEAGVLTLPLSSADAADVVLVEYHPSGRALRGWLHLGALPEDAILAAPGRWLDVGFSDPGHLVRLEAVIDRERPLTFDLGSFDSGQPARVWLPDALDTVRVVGLSTSEPRESAVSPGDFTLRLSVGD